MALRSCLLAIALASLSFPAWGQSPGCLKRDELVRHLESQYRESVVASGLADNGGLIEVFAAPDGETWTLIVSMPNGIACMVATGQRWEAVPHKLKGESL